MTGHNVLIVESSFGSEPLRLEQLEDGYWLGTVQFLGVDFHFELLRVTDVHHLPVYLAEGQEAILEQMADEQQAAGWGCACNDERWSKLSVLTETSPSERLKTVQLPGHPGDYVAWMTPFQE